MREKLLEKIKINGSVFTISAPSYRLGDAPPGVPLSHPRYPHRLQPARRRREKKTRNALNYQSRVAILTAY